MATVTPVLSPEAVPLEEYLRTTYRPDRDWIDGEARERNMGEQSHARIQAFLAYFFRMHAREWQSRVLTEQRVQVSPERFRILDLCVLPLQTPLEEIVRTPPLLCIEVLSRQDSMSEMQERVEEYLALGAPAVWVIDPRRRRAYTATAAGLMQPVADALQVAETPIRVALLDIFAELDAMEPRA